MSSIYVDSLVNKSGDNDSGLDLSTNDVVAIKTADTERCRVDASGNLLVGKASSDATATGVELRSGGRGVFTASSDMAMQLRRYTDDGDILQFRKDGTTVGSIGVVNTTNPFFASSDRGLRITGNNIRPCSGDGANLDNTIDLGDTGQRFDDIYATNGTIQTSDRNEKQQISSLTAAEITAATAISKLFKTFKWNSAVEAKGDAARTHTGVIAQQVETAMTDAGLDAGDYAFFISSDWYVDADGNEVEADAEGAIAKNRKGIRYPELLAFVGAATEQRLADIETRLTALETA